MAAHQVFGFVPYWMMGQVSGTDLSRLTTVAYFSVGVNGNGTFHESGPGWAGYQSSQLTALVKQAHAAGDRVVLTVNSSDQHTLDQLTHSAQAPYRLARAITEALITKSLDGVNIDFEGIGSNDRAGLVTLVTELSQQLRAVDPNWQITMDTYGSSASDPSGFFDVQGLALAVDAFFVMAYDMGSPHAVSPTAPLTGPDLNDTEVVSSYLSTVPASQILLGIPFYAYVFPTAGALPGARVTGASVAMTEDQIETEAKQVYWDSTAGVAWTAWRGGQQWYQTYFDDPNAVAAKVRLAGQSGLAGVGVWTLGMGNSEAMRSALTLGGATKDWSPSPEPPISEADTVLASLSPPALLSSSDLSSSDLSSAFSDLSNLSGLLGSDFGFGAGDDGGDLSSGLSGGDQSLPIGSPATTPTTPGTTTPGSPAPGTTNQETTSPPSTTPPTTNPGTAGSGSTNPGTAGSGTPGPGTTTPTTGAGGPSPGGSGTPPPSHLCDVVRELQKMAEALLEPGASNSQASAVAAAIAVAAPGCAQNPQTFTGSSAQLCDLLAGVAQVATLGPTDSQAADTLYERAGCGATVPLAPGSGQLAAGVQVMACAMANVADQEGPAAAEEWASWLSTTADCSPFQPLGSVPQSLSPLVDEVPNLATALGDSTTEVCSIERAVGVPDQRC